MIDEAAVNEVMVELQSLALLPAGDMLDLLQSALPQMGECHSLEAEIRAIERLADRWPYGRDSAFRHNRFAAVVRQLLHHDAKRRRMILAAIAARIGPDVSRARLLRRRVPTVRRALTGLDPRTKAAFRVVDEIIIALDEHVCLADDLSAALRQAPTDPLKGDPGWKELLDVHAIVTSLMQGQPAVA